MLRLLHLLLPYKACFKKPSVDKLPDIRQFLIAVIAQLVEQAPLKRRSVEVFNLLQRVEDGGLPWARLLVRVRLAALQVNIFLAYNGV